MPGKKIISISEARKHLFELAEEVQKPGNFCTLTVEGDPKLILIAKKEFDALMETIELLSNPELIARIKKIEDEYARGEYYSWESIKERLGLEPKAADPDTAVRTPRAAYRFKKS